jgi:hypothetical protein
MIATAARLRNDACLGFGVGFCLRLEIPLVLFQSNAPDEARVHVVVR